MTMETKTENKEQQWKDPVSSYSSSRSSSITSDSSDGHFVLRQFPLPKPSLSASEAQKQRETHQAYSSSVSSYTSSSWSQNHLIDLPGYDPNRIPSSVFSSKPGNSTEWSIASNDSLFSIHDGNFNSLREDVAFSGTFRSGEVPKLEETVHEITEINPVPLPLPPPPLPPVKKPNQSEKETITTEEKPEKEESSDSDIDDNDDEIKEKEIIELDVKEEEIIEEAEILVETETEKPEEKEIVDEDVKENNKPDDSNSIVSNSPSVSCRSDTSTNSISSFAFPVLKNEDGVIKTPVIEIRNNLSQKRRPEYLLPQSPMQRPQQQPQLTQQLEPPQSLPEPQRMSSKKSDSQTQSPKASKMKMLSCFRCPKKCGLFK